MVLGRLLLLLPLLLAIALPWATTGAKDCVFCELTDSLSCPGTHMSCGEDEDCFIGHGVAQGVGPILNKGCVHSTSCGREEPVSYMGVTYTLTGTCCYGHMCNRGPPGPATTGLLLALPLLQRFL